MILFDESRYHKTKDGGIYLSYSQIEELTENILLDYKPEALRVPQAIENDDFLECYLEVNLDYQYIYTTGRQGDILGCAIFEEELLPIFDKENMCKNYIRYDPNTVVLDLSLVNGDRKVQQNITGLHEGGHIWLHGNHFRDFDGQLCLGDVKRERFCCRYDEVHRNTMPRFSNAEMWREWQATTFAVTLALPKRSLEISVREIFRKYGVSTKQLITDEDCHFERLAYEIIPSELNEIYDMSKESIRYRLENTGFYTTRKKYEEEHSQMSLFDFL